MEASRVACSGGAEECSRAAVVRGAEWVCVRREGKESERCLVQLCRYGVA